MKGEGYAWEDALRFSNQISGAATWIGKEVMIRAVPVTLADVKVDIAGAQQFIRNQNLEKLAVCRVKELRKGKESQPVESSILRRSLAELIITQQ